jgi:hypothetical protein
VRDEDRRRAVAALPCQHCGIEGQTQAAHSNRSADGKALGKKASDRYLAALCVRCHTMVDSSYRLTRAERDAIWEAAHQKTNAALE